MRFFGTGRKDEGEKRVGDLVGLEEEVEKIGEDKITSKKKVGFLDKSFSWKRMLIGLGMGLGLTWFGYAVGPPVYYCCAHPTPTDKRKLGLEVLKFPDGIVKPFNVVCVNNYYFGADNELDEDQFQRAELRYGDTLFIKPDSRKNFAASHELWHRVYFDFIPREKRKVIEEKILNSVVIPRLKALQYSASVNWWVGMLANQRTNAKSRDEQLKVKSVEEFEKELSLAVEYEVAYSRILENLSKVSGNVASGHESSVKEHIMDFLALKSTGEKMKYRAYYSTSLNEWSNYFMQKIFDSELGLGWDRNWKNLSPDLIKSQRGYNWGELSYHIRNRAIALIIVIPDVPGSIADYLEEKWLNFKYSGGSGG